MFPITEAWDGYEINDAILEEYNASVMELSVGYLRNAADKAEKSRIKHREASNDFRKKADEASSRGYSDAKNLYGRASRKASDLANKRTEQRDKFKSEANYKEEAPKRAAAANDAKNYIKGLDARYL